MSDPTSPYQAAVPKSNLDGSEQIEIASGPTVTKTTTQAIANLGAVGNLQTVTVSLTSDQILNCDQFPVQIIAAPGSGKMTLVMASIYELDFGATPYTTGEPYGLYYGDISGPAADNGAQGDPLSQSADFVGFSGFGSAVGAQTSTVGNAAVVFTAQNAITGGDGTLQITVFYLTVTL